MKLYLASSIGKTAKAIAKDIGNNSDKLKLVFITTASEVEDPPFDWQENDRKGLINVGFNVFDYSIRNKTMTNFDRDLGKADIVHINGGNTFYLLKQMRLTGFNKWITNAVNKGKIYTGSSAGSLVAGNTIEHVKAVDDATKAKSLTDYQGLSLVNVTLMVHWGNEYNSKKRIEVASELFGGKVKPILLQDWQYLKVEGDMYKVVDIRD